RMHVLDGRFFRVRLELDRAHTPVVRADALGPRDQRRAHLGVLRPDAVLVGLAVVPEPGTLHVAERRRDRGEIGVAAGLPVDVLLVVIGVLLVGGAAAFAYYARKRRIQEWQQTAGHLGFQYSTGDPFELLNLPLALFQRGEGRGCENVVWGQKDGLDIKAFEF